MSFVLRADLGPAVQAGFTSRERGVSTGPWTGLNLALHVGDDPAAVMRNRELLRDWVGVEVQFLSQVHGTVVHVVGATKPENDLLSNGMGPQADAVIGIGVGHAVGVLVADCVPVLLADPDAGVVAAAHAGRKGLLAGVLERTVEAMIGHGAQPTDIRAVIGPAAGSCCYEVPTPMRSAAVAQIPEMWGVTRAGTPSLDLPAGCRAVLTRAGVEQISTVGICTIDDDRFYSYRRAPVTGRFAGVVKLLA